MSLDNIRYILLKSLSSIFSKLSSSNNYKILTAIAQELEEIEVDISEAQLASTVTSASCGDLDLHGKTFGLTRINGELDEVYRQRLLTSYDRSSVTFNNLSNLVKAYSLGPIEAYQSFYDRWWLGGKYLPARAIENVNTITGTIVRASSGLLTNTVPECWLQWDSVKTGTNYASGSTFVNDASGSLITLTTPVTAGTPVTIIYTPNEVTSGDYTYDIVPRSFLNRDTIVRHRLLTNNFILLSSTKNDVTIRTNMLPDYPVYISYYDADLGVVYLWETYVDDDKTIIINESERTDNLIVDEYSLPAGLNEVTTAYEIGNVSGVYLSTDTTKAGINYATTNNFSGNIITLDTPLPERTGVITSYNRYHIDDYSKLNFSQFVKTGQEDLRFTIQFNIWQAYYKYGNFKYGQIKWGQFTNPSVVLIGEILDLSKAAGIKSDLLVMTNEVKYGNRYSIYAEVFYGGSYF